MSTALFKLGSIAGEGKKEENSMQAMKSERNSPAQAWKAVNTRFGSGREKERESKEKKGHFENHSWELYSVPPSLANRSNRKKDFFVAKKKKFGNSGIPVLDKRHFWSNISGVYDFQ